MDARLARKRGWLRKKEGRGTRVRGVALFGDLRAQLEAGQLARTARLAVAKVINDRGGFDAMHPRVRFCRKRT